MNIRAFEITANELGFSCSSANLRNCPMYFTVTLSPRKLLNTTHFKALAKLGTYKSSSFVFVVGPEETFYCDNTYEHALAVMQKAAASKATTREALAERKAKLATKRAAAPTQAELEEYVLEFFGYESAENYALAREALSRRAA